MADKARALVRDELVHAKSLTQSAARSSTYRYPIKGIYHFLSHRSLQKPLLAKLAPVLTLGAATILTMFLVTYLPQMAVLAFTEGPLAPFSAVLLVLSESSVVFVGLSRWLVLDEALVDVFDGVLVGRGEVGLVEEGRIVKNGNDVMGRLGKVVKKPFKRFAPRQMLRYLMLLPLNFVPVVGTVIFVALQGKRAGPGWHDRYFQLKRMGVGKRDGFVEKNRGAYTSFGIAATLLEMVPIVGIFFAFTNTVGAALWAADMEAEEKSVKGAGEGKTGAGSSKM